MVDSPRDPTTRDAPGIPRWVIGIGIAAIIVVVLAVVVMISGGGEHGPGRHAASADAGGPAAMQQDHADAMAHVPAGMAHELPNSITLQPGETKQLTWRFGHTGTVEYACHEPGHYQAGMRGDITVS